MASKLNTQDVSTILSRLPGVGNEEFTEKERDYILKLAHSKNIRPKEAHDKSTGADMLEGVDIPRFVGRYDIREYQLPQEQPKYNVDDEAIQCKLSDIYEQDRDGLLEDGHDMVIASSTDLCLDPSAELLNKPVVEGERIVLFLNGGGFIMSDTAALKWFYLRISKELGQRVFVPRYNIAPKHVFPRALHDVYTAYSHLIVQGFKPENINLMGTSSGGQLAVALMLLLDMHKRQMVSSCLLLSPMLDLTMTQDSWERNQEICVLPHYPISDPKCLSRIYYGPTSASVEELDKQFRHPLISPLFCDPTRLPPMQIQVGEDDVLVDDSKEFALKVNKAHSQNNRQPYAELITYPGRNHFSIARGKSLLDKLYGNMRRFIDGVHNDCC